MRVWTFSHRTVQKEKVEKIQLLNLAVKSCAIIKCHFFRNWKRKSPFRMFSRKNYVLFHSAVRWSTQSLCTTVQQIKDYKISTPFKQVKSPPYILEPFICTLTSQSSSKEMQWHISGGCECYSQYFHSIHSLWIFSQSQTHSWPLSSRSLPKT